MQSGKTVTHHSEGGREADCQGKKTLNSLLNCILVK